MTTPDETKLMNENSQETTNQNCEPESSSPETNPDWAHDALADLEEWIESQGIYIRQ